MNIQESIKLFTSNRLIEIAKKKAIPIYFVSLSILLLFVYLPSFSHPPRSDFWSTAYFFHSINSFPAASKWMHIFQYDPWSQVRFQPLAYSILYIEHLLFGSNFVYFHIFNFILYFISILLLYKLALNFCKSKILTAVFMGVFAFLFSHFDIISWSFHIYIIFAFCSFLLGFILYINFLRSGKTILLPFVIFLFLLGMLCYEIFVLWPLAIVILSYMGNITDRHRFKKYKLVQSYLSVIGLVYFLYFAIFFLTRFFSIYEAPLVLTPGLFSIQTIVFSSFAVFFNILYNGLLINFIPSLAFPIIIDANLNLGGFLTKISSPFLDNLIFFGGSLFIGVFLAIAIYLLKYKYFNILKTIVFFLFLLFSEFFILFHFRRFTNLPVFILTQFRYLYISNAFVTLMVLYLIDSFLKPTRRVKGIICLILFVILILNIQASRQGIAILNTHLVHLKRMLLNIRIGIKNGQINKENRLFINDDIAKKLPPLCWNKEMGKLFMENTYQWAFSEEEIKCFSSFEDAKWIVDEEDFNIIVEKPDK